MNENPDLLNMIAERRRNIGLLRSGDSWTYDNEPLDAFESFFSGLLGGKTIRVISNEILRKCGELRILNVMGGTEFMQDLPATDRCGIRLSKNGCRCPDEIIDGDILSRNTWRRVGKEYDLIFSMPRAGLYFIENKRHRRFVVSMIWERLAPSGLILLQLDIADFNDLSDWINTPLFQENGLISMRRTIDPKDKQEYLAVAVLKQ